MYVELTIQSIKLINEYDTKQLPNEIFNLTRLLPRWRQTNHQKLLINSTFSHTK